MSFYNNLVFKIPMIVSRLNSNENHYIELK